MEAARGQYRKAKDNERVKIRNRRTSGGGLHGHAVAAASAALLGTGVAALLAPWLGEMTLRIPVIVIPGGLVAALLFWIQRRGVAAKLRRQQEIKRAHQSTIEALTLAIDAKDPHARGHVRGVQAYALELAHHLEVPEGEYEAIRTAALLHDIGKLAVPDHLLHKTGKLSDREFQKIKVHPTVGAEILCNVEFPYPVLPIIRHHHERWDGSGYPEGLVAESIPHGARILAIADSFEALTSDRVYRVRKSPEEACALIEAWSGVHFDPEMVHALRENLSSIVEAAEKKNMDPAQGASVIDTNDLQGHAPSRGAVPPTCTEGAATDAGGFGDRLHRSIATGSTSGDPSEASGRAGMEETRPPATAGDSVVLAGDSALRDISSAHREVFALYEIAQTLGSSLRLGEVLELVIHKVGHLIPYHTCAIYLLQEPDDTLTARFVSGAHAKELRGRTVPLGEGITGTAAESKSARLSSEPALDLSGLAIDPARYSTVAAFPLYHDGKILGAMTLYFPRGIPCQEDHVRMMDIIAKLVSGAVFNGTVFAETQESALTDDLTGLPNSRFLRQIFEQEVIRSQQAGQPMAFLEMDFDNFKAINDQYGHQAGDRYLTEVSHILKSNLRERDILVRLSGDEFAAILPRTGFAQAALLTERLQQSADIFSLKLEDGKRARAGLSIGIALHPQDGENFEDLMLKADYNMYQNKAARKSLRRGRSPNIIPFPIRTPGS
jgi:diguanylate cyclase (GGDEF)-like protein/putative nucleotidyltransferase with HDIG domain